jgi:hypothetical protein
VFVSKLGMPPVTETDMSVCQRVGGVARDCDR